MASSNNTEGRWGAGDGVWGAGEIPIGVSDG